MRWVLVLMMLTGAALAQGACPVKIQSITAQMNVFGVRFTNTSDKPIVGAEFMGYDINPVGEKKWHYVVMWDGKAKPGQSKVAENRLITQRNIGAGATLVKARFKDGSTWEPPDKFMNKECLFEKAK